MYPPIAFSEDGALEVRPLYYGLLMFSELVANNSHWAETDVDTKSDYFVAHAAVDANGLLRVLIADKDLTHEGKAAESIKICPSHDLHHRLHGAPHSRHHHRHEAGARIATPITAAEARLVRLTAPSYKSKLGDGITYAGWSFDSSTDGNPTTPRKEESVSADSSGCFTVSLPPLSAAMLLVQT